MEWLLICVVDVALVCGAVVDFDSRSRQVSFYGCSAHEHNPALGPNVALYPTADDGFSSHNRAYRLGVRGMSISPLENRTWLLMSLSESTANALGRSPRRVSREKSGDHDRLSR